MRRERGAAGRGARRQRATPSLTRTPWPTRLLLRAARGASERGRRCRRITHRSARHERGRSVQGGAFRPERRARGRPPRTRGAQVREGADAALPRQEVRGEGAARAGRRQLGARVYPLFPPYGWTSVTDLGEVRGVGARAVSSSSRAVSSSSRAGCRRRRRARRARSQPRRTRAPHQFGLGIGLYFATLRNLFGSFLLISFFASYQMSYYASDEYRDHQGYLTDGEGNPLTDDGGNPLKEPTLLGNPFGMGGDLAVSAACMNWVGAFPFKRENKTHFLCRYNHGVVYVNLVIVLILLLVNYVMGVAQEKQAEAIDEDAQTAQDYSIVVQDPDAPREHARGVEGVLQQGAHRDLRGRDQERQRSERGTRRRRARTRSSSATRRRSRSSSSTTARASSA